MCRYFGMINWILVSVIAALLLVGCASTGQSPADEGGSAEGSEDLDQLVMQGPANVLALSVPFFQVLDDGALEEHAEEVRYEPWKNPDELRARLSSEQADVSAVPTYVGANLYNRELDVRLINTLVWGMLYVVGPDGEQTDWSSLEGQSVIVPFKGDMPDLVFRYLAEKNGLDPQEDLDIQYVSAPPEAVQTLLSGRADYAVLPEHLATVAVLKGGQAEVPLARSLSLQEEWAAATGREPRFPQAGILVSGQIADEHPEVVEALQAQFEESIRWINENPEEAARLAAERMDGIEAPVAEAAIPNLNLEYRTAAEAKEELEFFFEELSTLSPEIIGGKLPDDGFYYGE